MFSGKTTELLRRVRRFGFANRCIVVVNHIKDQRHGREVIGTHDDVTWKALSSDLLSDSTVERAVERADVVAVDEGQFFSDLVPGVTAWADAGKIVSVAALDSTFERKPFDTVRDLVPDEVTKLTAVCFGCGEDASCTRRITKETAIEVVGGTETYEAVCRTCYVAGSDHVDE